MPSALVRFMLYALCFTHCVSGIISRRTGVEDVLRAILVRDMPRALLLAATAFVLTLITGGYWVRFLRAKKIGKQIRVEGPQSHMIKTGTPTMGGIIILLPVVLLTLAFNLVDRWSMLLP